MAEWETNGQSGQTAGTEGRCVTDESGTRVIKEGVGIDKRGVLKSINQISRVERAMVEEDEEHVGGNKRPGAVWQS